ncbi:class I SAM-dependent methyltransferase [Dyadobacter psychrophilus]|uniref:Methyltransferase domain-containing protein n=1 Tax=Dyadobacter psychrophilus TaxID=651661 RepID=A0A1T5GDS1_9BACT|nr:SAM-dependent methyltransferase [Dyadobacter psychrophilus]SKC06539.1 Methyltransferase domain-containing protein [Dyadobacter psychrophilus]
MNILPKVEEFIAAFEQSISNNSFIKLSLGNYHGSEENLKNIYVKRILIKKEEKFSFTYRYKTRDIVKNYNLEEVKALFGNLVGTDFHVATLFTNSEELQFEILKNNKVILKRKATETKEVPLPEHDHSKNRLISSGNKPYLHELNITDKDGTVFKKAQDKFRQINHYIEILSALIKEIPTDKQLNVADMGSGKGYLTFALYDYLQNVLHVDAHVTGVEFRPDLVSLCNSIAEHSNFKNLHFEEGSIDNFNSEGVNMLIALHACDTATDDAIFKGISAGSDLIVVAPCCHKQIRREIEKNKTANDVQFLTRYGIFLERQAEMVTDGIRALILEYFGYKTKVFEFISDAHTPKNVLIVGTKDRRNAPDQPAILKKIRDARQYFGIDYHHLEKIAGLQSH